MIKVGITQGDINGVGYEVILKTFADARLTEMFIPVIYGSMKVALTHRKMMNLPQIQFNQIQTAQKAVVNRVNIINCIDENTTVDIGQSTPEGGAAALAALERATSDLGEGIIDVIVTAPINKDNIQSEGFHFPGHTEYLENKFAKNGEKTLMIMTSESLKVAVVTGHIPLASVSQSLSIEKIVNALKIYNLSLIRDFNIENPKIAVLGLNPHAGENGLLGNEEETIITPAIKQLQNEGIYCFGPFPADGFFGSSEYKDYDAVLAMYHDQGLIPFKALSMENGVNFTAGLSIVRSSPAHGTAYNIAGKNVASEESFREAIYQAIDAFNNRAMYDEAFRNPLKKLYFERGNDNVVLNMDDNND